MGRDAGEMPMAYAHCQEPLDVEDVNSFLWLNLCFDDTKHTIIWCCDLTILMQMLYHSQIEEDDGGKDQLSPCPQKEDLMALLPYLLIL